MVEDSKICEQYPWEHQNQWKTIKINANVCGEVQSDRRTQPRSDCNYKRNSERLLPTNRTSWFGIIGAGREMSNTKCANLFLDPGVAVSNNQCATDCARHGGTDTVAPCLLRG